MKNEETKSHDTCDYHYRQITCKVGDCILENLEEVQFYVSFFQTLEDLQDFAERYFEG